MEEEIDLRRYAEVLLEYKFWIVGLALLAAVIALVISSLMPLLYEAEASLVMLRVRSEVTFEPKFKTLSGDELTPETLMILAGRPSVAAAIFQQLGERLNGEAENLDDLQEMVVIENRGDLILIKVQAHDSRLAADIANAWAQEAESSINAIYDQPLQLTQELQTQLQKAQGGYQAAQSDLEAFLTQNQAPSLEREIDTRRELITGCQQSLINNQVALYGEALSNRHQILSGYYAELTNIELALLDSRSLLGELQWVGSAPATEWAQALAFIGVQNRAFGAEGQQLQFLISGEAPATDPQDLERLIEALEAKAASVRASIAQQEQQLLDVDVADTVVASDHPLEQHIDSLTREMVALQSQLEEEAARKRELTQARNLAWETYQTVARKLAEAEVTVQAPGSEVRLAAAALRPERPVSRGRLMYTAVAGMLGLMTSTLGVLFLDWWRQEPSTSEEIEGGEEAVHPRQIGL